MTMRGTRLAQRSGPIDTLAVSLLMAPALAGAATFEVDGANASCSDAVGTPFCTIQAAIDNAAAGDTVEVSAGLYVENLIVDRGLTLRGAGISAVTGACDGETRLAGGPALTVQAGVSAEVLEVTILGSGSAWGGGVFNAGELRLADSEVCQNFASIQGSGIYTEGMLFLQRVQVYDNLPLIFGTEGGGLFVQNGGGALIDQSSFDGNWATRGGGISVAAGAWLVMARSSLESNFADDSSPSLLSGQGAGIDNAGWAWIDQTQIGRTLGGGNVVLNSTGRGGGINNSGALLLTRSTLAGNAVDMVDPLAAPGVGAGLSNSGSAAVVSSTISGNLMNPGFVAYGAGIYNDGILSVSNATITDNANGGAGVSMGAGVFNENGGLVELRNTIVAHQAVGDDCHGAILTEGYNIDSDDTCDLVSVGSGGTDQPAVADAGLLPLSWNGGPTRTHALADDSPAVDAGDPAGCQADVDADGVPETPLVGDQRGDLFVDVPGLLPDPSGCDAGAVELNLVANGTIEDDDDGDDLPDDWTGVGLASGDRRYCAPGLAHAGRCFAALVGDAAVTKQLVQEIDRPGGAPGDGYTLRVFNNGLGLIGAPRVVIQFDDLQTIGPGEEFELLLNTGSYVYQERSVDVVTTVNSGYDVVRILIEPGSGGLLGIDDVSLVPHP